MGRGVSGGGGRRDARAQSPCDRCKHKKCLQTGEPCELVEKTLPKPGAGKEPKRPDPARALAATRMREPGLKKVVSLRAAAMCHLHYSCEWTHGEIALATRP